MRARDSAQPVHLMGDSVGTATVYDKTPNLPGNRTLHRLLTELNWLSIPGCKADGERRTTFPTGDDISDGVRVIDGVKVYTLKAQKPEKKKLGTSIPGVSFFDPDIDKFQHAHTFVRARFINNVPPVVCVVVTQDKKLPTGLMFVQDVKLLSRVKEDPAGNVTLGDHWTLYASLDAAGKEMRSDHFEAAYKEFLLDPNHSSTCVMQGGAEAQRLSAHRDPDLDRDCMPADKLTLPGHSSPCCGMEGGAEAQQLSAHRDPDLDLDCMPADKLTRVCVMAMDELAANTECPNVSLFAFLFARHLAAVDMAFAELLLDAGAIVSMAAAALEAWAVPDSSHMKDVLEAQDQIAAVLEYEPERPAYVVGD